MGDFVTLPKYAQLKLKKLLCVFNLPGTEAVQSQTVNRPLLGSYLPVNPIQRYTFKKWDPADWNRHNESKKFQSNRDREASRK